MIVTIDISYGAGHYLNMSPPFQMKAKQNGKRFRMRYKFYINGGITDKDYTFPLKKKAKEDIVTELGDIDVQMFYSHL